MVFFRTVPWRRAIFVGSFLRTKRPVIFDKLERLSYPLSVIIRGVVSPIQRLGIGEKSLMDFFVLERLIEGYGAMGECKGNGHRRDEECYGVFLLKCVMQDCSAGRRQRKRKCCWEIYHGDVLYL